jgi:hypothetical protein
MEPKAEAGGEMSVVRDRCRLNWKEKSFSATTQVVNSTEPLGADPHARWCGMGGGSPSPLFRLMSIAGEKSSGFGFFTGFVLVAQEFEDARQY